uniref:hypothetical protein n=1 Tax=Desulfovirgula thermocuniculi TaxID=348842 RepID=UPI00054D77F6
MAVLAGTECDLVKLLAGIAVFSVTGAAIVIALSLSRAPTLREALHRAAFLSALQIAFPVVVVW